MLLCVEVVKATYMGRI